MFTMMRRVALQDHFFRDPPPRRLLRPQRWGRRDPVSGGALQPQSHRAAGEQAGRGELVRQVPAAGRPQQAAALPPAQALAGPGR